MPNVDNPPSTHWEGCWRDPRHHACAVAEIDSLQITRMQLESSAAIAADVLQSLRSELGQYQSLTRRVQNAGYVSLNAFIDDALDALHVLDESYIEHPDMPNLTTTVASLLATIAEH